MNIFNRIVMFLASLVIFAFGLVTYLLLSGLVIPSNTYLRAVLALYRAWQAVALMRGASTNTAQIVALLLTLIGLVLIVLELLPIGRLFRRREAKQYVVRHDAVGEVTVVRSMVRDVVQHEAESVPGVLHAEPNVKDGPDGLRVSTRASLAWDVDAPSVGQMLQERIKEAVQTHLGLPVASVSVTTEAVPLEKEPRRRVRVA